VARGKISSKMARMKPAAPFRSEQTVVGHGVYLIAVALVLFFAPGALRLMLAFPAEFDWWNRVLALPVFNLGVFCIGCAWAKSRMLINLTIVMRTLVMVAVAALVALGAAPLLALGVGVIDIASAALTAWAMASERQNSTA
jgi:hypothetical protein